MSADRRQLSFRGSAHVCLEFHPSRQPPDAAGPGDFGAFSATLEAHPCPAGWGRSEQLALTGLAIELRTVALEESPGEALSPATHALDAAARLELGDVIDWLRARASEPLMHEPTTPP